jgi:hypothetical protein
VTLVGLAIVQPVGLLVSFSESILLKFSKFVRPASILSPFHPMTRKEILDPKSINLSEVYTYHRNIRGR